MASSFDMVALEDKLSYVLPYVNGAPNATALFHLRQAAIQFCRRTLIWQATLRPMLTVVDRDTYPLLLPDDSRLVQIIRCQYGDRHDSDLLSPVLGRWQRTQSPGCNADAVYTEDRLSFTVLPMPKTAGDPIVLDVALCPTEDATEIPEFIADQYIAEIALGAISTISAIPRQSFTDQQTAEAFGRRFNDAISRAARIVSKGSARSVQRVRGHFF